LVHPHLLAGHARHSRRSTPLRLRLLSLRCRNRCLAGRTAANVHLGLSVHQSSFLGQRTSVIRPTRSAAMNPCACPSSPSVRGSHPASRQRLALFPFAAIVPGAKRSVVAHLAGDIVRDLFWSGAEELAAGNLPGVKVRARQLGVVIQHALEVGCTQSNTSGAVIGARLPLDSMS
jgi:hypothetical protein